MSGEETEMAFEEALEKILNEEQVPIHLLYHLSDISENDLQAFARLWPDAPDDRRREIIRHLVDISEDDFIVDFRPLFSYGLADPFYQVRIASLDGLWDTTDLSLVDPIIDRMQNDVYPEVQAAAAGALAHYLLMAAWGELKDIRSKDITAALLAAYNDPESDLLLRRVALEALGSVNLPEVRRAIEESYESPHLELQLSALFAMGSSADPRWLPILLDEMESPYEEIRLEAVRAAGNIGDSQAIPRLAELAYDDSEEVAVAAIAALGEIGGEQAGELLTAMVDDSELEELHEIIHEVFEESTWNALDLQFSLFTEDFWDEEE